MKQNPIVPRSDRIPLCHQALERNSIKAPRRYDLIEARTDAALCMLPNITIGEKQRQITIYFVSLEPINA